MNPTVDTISDALRGNMGLAVSELVPPNVLARWLRLELRPSSAGRSGLYGERLEYDDEAPPELQDYQIARAACAYALCQMGLIRNVSPHDLAVVLCGVALSAPQRAANDQLAPVVRLPLVRARRRSAFLRSGF